MKVGDLVLDARGERCVIAYIDKKRSFATVFNLKPGMYNPVICEIEELRMVPHEDR